MIIYPREVSKCGRFKVGDVVRGKHVSSAGGKIVDIDILGQIQYLRANGSISDHWNPQSYELGEPR